MEDLAELNRALVRSHETHISRAEIDIAGQIRVCVAVCALTANDLRGLLQRPVGRLIQNTAKGHLIRMYFEYMRICSRECHMGNVASLQRSSLTLAQVDLISGLSNRDIALLATMNDIEFFTVDMASIQALCKIDGMALQHAVAAYQPPVAPWSRNKEHSSDRCVLPAAATISDLQWRWSLNSIAIGLVSHRAKGKVVKLLTDINHSTLKSVYQDVHKESPPPGPVPQDKPTYFVTANNSNHHYGPSWNVNASILVGELTRLRNATKQPPNAGWLLLHAFRSYLDRTEALKQRRVEQLDINQAYRLLMMTSLGIPEYAKIARRRCHTCTTPFLFLADRESDDQPCPVCAISKGGSRLWRTIPPLEATG